MKLLGPQHSDQARGSMSGYTIRQYRGLHVCSRKLRPVRRWVGLQPNNRSIMGYLSRAWALLTPAEMQSWKDWAENHPEPDGFGGTFQLDGNQAHIKLNHTAIRLGGISAYKEEAPLTEPVATIDTIALADGVGAGEIGVTVTHLGTGDATDHNQIWIAGPYGSPGRVSVQSRYVFNQAVAGNLLVATIVDLVADAWYWVRASYTSLEGQVTNYVSAQHQAPAGI